MYNTRLMHHKGYARPAWVVDWAAGLYPTIRYYPSCVRSENTSLTVVHHGAAQVVRVCPERQFFFDEAALRDYLRAKFKTKLDQLEAQANMLRDTITNDTIMYGMVTCSPEPYRKEKLVLE